MKTMLLSLKSKEGELEKEDEILKSSLSDLVKQTNNWSERLSDCHCVAVERRRSLESTSTNNDVTSLAEHLLLLLEESYALLKSYFQRIRKNSDSDKYGEIFGYFSLLREVLKLHLSVSQLDWTLGEEMAKAGSHVILSKITHHQQQPDLSNEQEEDAWMEIQDLAFEIAAASEGQFPIKKLPFTHEELHSRLPLSFKITPISSESSSFNAITILIHQVTKRRQSAQQDVGFVMWPSAVVLSKYILTNPRDTIIPNQRKIQNVSEYRILELGAGCGLVGLVVAKYLQHYQNNNSSDCHTKIILTDFNTLVLENIHRNIKLNNLGTTDNCYQQRLDFHQNDEADKETIHFILAADVICKVQDAVAVADTIQHLLVPGGKAIVVSADAKHRFGVDRFESECLRVGLQITISNIADMYDGQLLPSNNNANNYQNDGIHQTSGYVDGMSLTMFQITKLQNK